MRKANEAGLLASLFLSQAFGSCAKIYNGASRFYIGAASPRLSFFRLSSLVFRLFHQLKHFFVFAAHAVAGAEDFFFVEGVGL